MRPSYNGSYGIWQYSSTGSVNGISGNVDLDYSYVDYPTQIKAKGLNGFSADNTPEQPVKKSIAVEMTVDGVRYKGNLQEV